ncbi:alpha/beta hydrolase [Capillimicrobium parvum]|uniref:Esterase n=1 Tax=Capillimicrobium parvum TaxID=2884022 RepID=A0A9E6XXY8_9ACTN|nr:esterase family protein [Capillimicrobium parvum]UGS36549.1 hypothetical protein DSM104329_02955 [Capillimicrobium parvum]
MLAVSAVAAVAALTVLPRLGGVVSTGAPGAHGATIERFDVHSRYVHDTLPQVAAAPAGGGAGRPLLVFLHGRGGRGPESDSNAAFYAALGKLGDRAPNVLFANGGDHSYYHRRGSGDWNRYMLDEVIPEAVRRLHADPKRIAIGGISMGGFGAYQLARQRPRTFCAVGGHSAALWRAGGETPAGAFDDARDFARNDLIALSRARGRAPWGRARLWLDGGTGDPFRSAGDAFAAALHIPMHHWPGGHDGSYWRAHYVRYLRFYAAALARC